MVFATDSKFPASKAATVGYTEACRIVAAVANP